MFGGLSGKMIWATEITVYYNYLKRNNSILKLFKNIYRLLSMSSLHGCRKLCMQNILFGNGCKCVHAGVRVAVLD